jgi:hypothetical protein
MSGPFVDWNADPEDNLPDLPTDDLCGMPPGVEEPVPVVPEGEIILFWEDDE